jgi:hypothetical protein
LLGNQPETKNTNTYTPAGMNAMVGVKGSIDIYPKVFTLERRKAEENCRGRSGDPLGSE